MGKGETLLAVALSKLTAELEKWRNNASHVTISGVRTPFRHSIDIEVEFREDNPIKDVEKLMKTYQETVLNKEDDKNDKKRTVGVTARITGEDTGPLGYQ